MKLALAVIVLVACSHADTSAKLTRALEGLGDKFAADAKAAMAHPPKSRIGIAEVLAQMTPDALAHQAPTLATFGVTPAEVAAYLHDHPEAIEQMLSRAEPAVAELLKSVASLPVAEPGDCEALERRVAVLRQTEPSYSEVLAAGLPPCAPCLGSGSHTGCGT
jgi:hypothetical protein